MCGGGGDNRVKETPEERELAKIAVEQWNDYQENFVPLENKFIEEVQMTGEDYTYAKGRAKTATTEAFGKARGSLRRPGQSINSGRRIANFGDSYLQESASAGKNVSSAEVAVDDLNKRGLMSAIQIGRGQKADTNLGLKQLTSRAVDSAGQDAYYSSQARAGRNSALGSAVGMGARSLGDIDD